MLSIYGEWIGSLSNLAQAKDFNSFDMEAIAVTKEPPFKVIAKVTYGEALVKEVRMPVVRRGGC
jgi:hypothetical protein